MRNSPRAWIAVAILAAAAAAGGCWTYARLLNSEGLPVVSSRGDRERGGKPLSRIDVCRVCAEHWGANSKSSPPARVENSAANVPHSPSPPRMAAGSIDFLRDVRPIFVEHCYRCHGPDKQEGGLRLDQSGWAFRQMPSGEVPVVAGNPDAGTLLERVSNEDESLRMPLADAPLSADQIAVLRKWIEEGADWPSTAAHWAFAKARQPSLPAVRNRAWPANPIDFFVLARLEQEQLKPAPEADRTTLIRRLSLDLTGLPPAPEEVDAFVADRSSTAYEDLVDRLLASSHYGERWAVRWLDLGRYADSNGYEYDATRIMWMYRDWVIHAFNQDLPFDQFTVEQLAGDLLPGSTKEQQIATGFMRNSPFAADLEQSRFERIIDRVNTLGTVWLGLSLGCAQCHNHKFDPITQAEYYRLYAIFNNAKDEQFGTNYGAPGLSGESPLNGLKGTTLTMQEEENPPETRIKVRGSYYADGDRVEPGVPAALHPPRSEVSNRLSLACWLVDEDNPLTARVTVNRFWESLFGVGLVRTSEDLGTRTEAPSHPELLDWLAVEFQRRGWSMKKLVRLMVTSATYRQAATVSPELLERDPQNRLLARGARFRVEAEFVRDISLTAAGLLSPALGGGSVFPPQPPGVSENVELGSFNWTMSDSEARYRRGLYTYWKRNALYPAFALFDAPNRLTACARRSRTTTPLQALVTLNDPAFFDAAVHLGKRMMSEGGATVESRVTRGFRLCLGRSPRPEELTVLTGLFRDELAGFQENRATARLCLQGDPRLAGDALLAQNPRLDLSEWAAWSIVANVLLNLDETITKE